MHTYLRRLNLPNLRSGDRYLNLKMIADISAQDLVEIFSKRNHSKSHLVDIFTKFAKVMFLQVFVCPDRESLSK